MPPNPKVTPQDLLSELRQWALIEGKLTDDKAARKAWHEIIQWAEGTAIRYKIPLKPLS
jgi:hypothetical protein